MDDISTLFGGTAPMTATEEAWHAEQRRKQFDIIRIKNPIHIIVKKIDYDLPAEDFYVEYDTNQFQRIPANSLRDIPRNRAERYVEHMKDKIVNFVNQKKHDEYIAERDRKGLPRYVDKATENKDTYETQDYPKTNDPEVVAEIYGQIWIGLVNKAGNDLPPDRAPQKTENNIKPVSEKALDNLKNRTVSPDEVQYPVQQEELKQQTAPIQDQSGFTAMNDQLDASEVSKDE